MVLIQTAEDILRDEFWLDENKYTKIQRDNFVSLIENYNDNDDAIDELNWEIRDLESEKEDLVDSMKSWISTLESISEDDDISSIMLDIKEAIKELRYWI